MHKIHSENRIAGALMVMGAMTLIAFVEGIGKSLMETLPWSQVFFLRFVAHFSLLAPFVIFIYRGKLIREFHPKMQIIRGAFVAASILLFVLAVSEMPLALALALVQVAPFVVAALSFAMLGERVRIASIFLILGGFIGVLLIARPDAGIEWHSIAAIAGGICYAGFMIMSRKMPSGIPAMAGSFYVAAVSIMMVLPLLLFIDMRPIDGKMTATFLLIGGMSLVAHYLMARAFNLAPAAFLAPFAYWEIVAGVIAGFLLHSYIPNVRDTAGISVIIVCGILLVLYDKGKKAKE